MRRIVEGNTTNRTFNQPSQTGNSFTEKDYRISDANSYLLVISMSCLFRFYVMCTYHNLDSL